MKLNYKFFRGESINYTVVQYDFPPPFHENLDRELKEMYGEDLTFLKEVNHRDRVIREHSAYDSGKGTRYVPPAKRRKRIDLILREAVKSLDRYYVIEFSRDFTKSWYLMNSKSGAQLFINATMNEKGVVAGYNMGSFTVSKKYGFSHLLEVFKKEKFYPDNVTHHFLK